MTKRQIQDDLDEPSTFINRLEQDTKAEKIELKIRSQIHIDNIVEWLAPRLPCPLDLEDYLTTRLGNIEN